LPHGTKTVTRPQAKSIGGLPLKTRGLNLNDFIHCLMCDMILVGSIDNPRAKIYGDGARAEEHLLVLIDYNEDKYVVYYEVNTMYKNFVEVAFFGFSKFEGLGDHLYFEGGGLGEGLSLTVLDVDEKEGTITVRYDRVNSLFLPEKKGKIVTFKRTNKFTGKTIHTGI